MLSFFSGEERFVLIFRCQNGPNMNLTGQGAGSAVFFIAVFGSALLLQAAAASASNGFHVVFYVFIWFSCGFHMSSHSFHMFSYGLHMVLIWFSYGIPLEII